MHAAQIGKHVRELFMGHRLWDTVKYVLGLNKEKKEAHLGSVEKIQVLIKQVRQVDNDASKLNRRQRGVLGPHAPPNHYHSLLFGSPRKILGPQASKHRLTTNKVGHLGS